MFFIVHSDELLFVIRLFRGFDRGKGWSNPLMDLMEKRTPIKFFGLRYLVVLQMLTVVSYYNIIGGFGLWVIDLPYQMHEHRFRGFEISLISF